MRIFNSIFHFFIIIYLFIHFLYIIYLLLSYTYAHKHTQWTYLAKRNELPKCEQTSKTLSHDIYLYNSSQSLLVNIYKIRYKVSLFKVWQMRSTRSNGKCNLLYYKRLKKRKIKVPPCFFSFLLFYAMIFLCCYYYLISFHDLQIMNWQTVNDVGRVSNSPALSWCVSSSLKTLNS